MCSLRPVGHSAATLDKERASACHFTFSGGRRCRTPHYPHRPHLCSAHARKQSQACAVDKLASHLTHFFSGEYLSTCDLCTALGRNPNLLESTLTELPASIDSKALT